MPNRTSEHSIDGLMIARAVGPQEMEKIKALGLGRPDPVPVISATPSKDELDARSEELASERGPQARMRFLSSCLTERERRHPVMREHLESIGRQSE